MTREEANAAISAKVNEAYAALREAKTIADEHLLGFSFSPAYGMGGYYQGNPENRSRYSEDGWVSSSQDC